MGQIYSHIERQCFQFRYQVLGQSVCGHKAGDVFRPVRADSRHSRHDQTLFSYHNRKHLPTRKRKLPTENFIRTSQLH